MAGRQSKVPGLGYAWLWRASTLAAALVPAVVHAAPPQDRTGPQNQSALSDIVVTAQRRSESSQQVPISIQTLDAKALDTLGARRLSDVEVATPSLSFGDGSEQGRTGIRGVIDYSRNAGYDSRVGVYVDGVYYSRSWMNNLTLLGIRQVDVLRGPQGTLFGKDTDAGALSITTIQPSKALGGEISADIGNFGYRQIAARSNLPLNDDLSLQLSGAHVQSDGYYRNVLLGKRNQGINSDAFRAQLRLNPNDGLDVTLAADFTDDDNSTLHYTYVPPAGRDPFEIRSYVNDGARRRVGGVSLTAQKDVGGGFQATSITAWRSGHQFLHFNNETGPTPILTADLRQYTDQFSQELRIASPRERRYDFVAGVFYFWGNNRDRQALTFGSGLRALGLGSAVGKVATLATSVSSDSIAGFFQANVRPSSLVELFAGARLTHERKRLNDITTADPTGLFSAPISGYRDALANTFFTPKGGINLHLKRNVLLFGTIGRGFKSGGWNVEATSPAAFAAGIRFRPETVTSYEVGFKSDFFDRRARVNVTGFYERFDDFQVFTFVNATVGGRTVLASSLSNVGKVSSKGIETEIAVIPVTGLTLAAQYTYDQSVYDRYPGGGGTVGNTVLNADGVQTPYAPRHKAYVSADYETALGSGLPRLQAHVGYSVQSSENFDPKVANPVYGKAYSIPGYDLADARIGLTSADGRWRASLWGRNIFDKHYIRFANRTAILGNAALLYGTPRTYGATLGYTF